MFLPELLIWNFMVCIAGAVWYRAVSRSWNIKSYSKEHDRNNILSSEQMLTNHDPSKGTEIIFLAVNRCWLIMPYRYISGTVICRSWMCSQLAVYSNLSVGMSVTLKADVCQLWNIWKWLNLRCWDRQSWKQTVIATNRKERRTQECKECSRLKLELQFKELYSFME